MNGLGRRVSVDVRDRAFMMAAALPLMAVPMPPVKAWAIGGKSLDQQSTSTCVGHAWRNFLRCAPLQSERGPSAFDLYREAILLDPWPDNDNEKGLPDYDSRLSSGTSVRAGAAALVKRNRLNQYLWAFDVDTISTWIRSQGPVVVGVNWYNSLSSPDAKGLVRLPTSASMIGGHAFLVRGANMRTELFMCENSWGDDWGSDGRFFIRFGDMARLISEDGEACTAVEEWIKP